MIRRAERGGVAALHVVTDDAVLARPDFLARARAVMERGGAGLALHLRGPRMAGGRLLALAGPLVAWADEVGATVVVNDRVDVALLSGAHAVQLGARSLSVTEARSVLAGDRRVGRSVHTLEEARGAAGAGADWLVLGTLFATPSHPARQGSGVGWVQSVYRDLPGCPLVGIGGITPDLAPSVVAAGASGVAVIRGIWDAPDPADAVERYLVGLTEAVSHPKEPS